MPPRGFICKHCGHCCLDLDAYEADASDADYRRWEREGRDDILEWVGVIRAGGVPVAYDIWIDPNEGDCVDSCPWLKKTKKKEGYRCTIHDMKPEICRNFPQTIQHALEEKCLGFNHLSQDQLESLIKEEKRSHVSTEDLIKFKDPFNYDKGLPCKNVLFIGNTMVPLAHITTISDIEYGIMTCYNDDNIEINAYSFTVHVAGHGEGETALNVVFAREDQTALARVELFRRLEDYYERLANGGKSLCKGNE